MLASVVDGMANALKRGGQLREDELSLEPGHPIAQPSEPSIAPSIGGTSPFTAAAIHLHDEFHLPRNEVYDVATQHYLPAKRYAELPGANGEPQRLLRS